MNRSNAENRTLRSQPENITSLFNHNTEASIVTKSYFNKSELKNTSKYLYFAPDMVADLEEHNYPENLALLVGAQWQVYKVSPLWNVPYKKPSEKTGNEMEEGIGSCPNVGRLVGDKSASVGYNQKELNVIAKAIANLMTKFAVVEISPLPGLRGNRFDSEALLVMVAERFEGKKQNVFTGVLCSVDAVELRLISTNATNLPVFLTRGSLTVTEQVIEGLQRSFDCVIGKLDLPTRELQWMSAMWVNLGPSDLNETNVQARKARHRVAAKPITDKDKQSNHKNTSTEAQSLDNEVKLIYSLPTSVSEELRRKVNHFTFKFTAYQLRDIWRCCRDNETEIEFTETEMETFHRSMALHIRRTMGIRLENLELIQIQLPVLRAHKGGRVAFEAVSEVKTVLRYITELCQGQVLEANPTLAEVGQTDADNFGRGPCVTKVPQQMVDMCLSSGQSFRGIDTAYMYSGGKSEEILGSMANWKGNTPMATKINPWDGKSLSRVSVKKQVETCLSRLQVPSVEIMYLHAPDHNTPLTETLCVMDELHKEGKFNQLGLSNYSSWLVNEVVNVCKANNWLQPTVYQGMYSGITRQVEEELIPCLRYHGLAFYAYSPLGGGILTGKHKFEQAEDKSIVKGRFNGVGWDKVYRDRYWKQEHFSAIEELKRLLKEHHPDEEITIPGAALRWIYNHSALDGDKGDCVILGASRLEQVEMNLKLSNDGSLSKPIVEFFDDWWKSTKHLCPTYFR